MPHLQPMAPRPRLPATSAWALFTLRTVYFLDSTILLIFFIYLQIHFRFLIYMSLTASAWGIILAIAELTGLASPATRVKRIPPIWLFVCELVSAALFATALVMNVGSYFGTPSQVLVGVAPDDHLVTIPLEKWRYGAFVMQIVGTLLAGLFMVIGCVDWCHKAR